MATSETESIRSIGGWRTGQSARYGRLLVLLLAAFLVSGSQTSAAESVLWLVNVLIVLSAFRLTQITRTPAQMAVFALLAVAAFGMVIGTDALDDRRAWAYLAQSVLLLLIMLGVLGSILRRPLVDGQTLLGATAAYILIGLAFSWLFLAMDLWDDSQISLDPSSTPEYSEFSFVVLTTIGFGNQIPTASLASRFVVIEAIFGQLFLATFVARIVSMYGSRPVPGGRGVRRPDADQDD